MKEIISSINYINELWLVLKMNQAERVLLRGKNDIFKSVSDHILTILFTLIVLYFTWTYLFSTNYIGFGLVENTLLIGLGALLTRSLSRKALFHYGKSVVSGFINMTRSVWSQIVNLFKNTNEISKKYKGYQGIAWYLLIIILIPILILFILVVGLILYVLVYGASFIFLFFINNEPFSYLLSVGLTKIAILIFGLNEFTLLIAVVPVFYIIGYTVRQRRMIFNPTVKEENGFELCKDKDMFSKIDGKRLYYDQSEDVFLVLFEDSDFVQIYEYRTKYQEQRLVIESWIRNRKAKKGIDSTVDRGDASDNCDTNEKDDGKKK